MTRYNYYNTTSDNQFIFIYAYLYYNFGLTFFKLQHHYLFYFINSGLNYKNKSYLSNFFSNLPISLFFIKEATDVFLQLPQNNLKTKIYKRDFILSFHSKRNKRLSKNFYKFYFLKFKHLHKKISRFSINQRMMLTARNIYKGLFNFFYSGVQKQRQDNLNLMTDSIKKKWLSKLVVHKEKRNIKIFFNAHKQLVAKMRKSRYAHWHLRVRGKLNEWRYHKLLGVELHNITRSSYSTFLNFILLRSFNFILCWQQIIKLQSFNLVLHNGLPIGPDPIVVRGDIFELPIFLNRRFYHLRTNMTNILSRSKRQAYKGFIKWNSIPVTKGKKFPKIVKKIPLNVLNLGSCIEWDVTTNSFSVIYKLSKFKNNLDFEIAFSSVLTLQNWRYRYD